MKILLINPSLRPDAATRYLPVGLGYVATAIKEAGFSFDLLDIDAANYSDDYVEKFFATNKYDVVAAGSIVTHYKWMKWMINTLKSYQPHCKVIIGNSVGGSIPEVLFQHSGVDVVIKGEADESTVEVIQALNDGKPLGEANHPLEPIPHKMCDLPPTVKGTGIPGIYFRDDKGNIVSTGLRKANRKIDDFPWPDWDLFDVETYIERARDTALTATRFPREEAVVMPVNTARGCVFKCTFCHYVYWNDPYRHRSAQSIIGEIKRNQKKYGANYINFWDELSFHKLNVAEKFVDELLAEDLNIHWTAAVRSDLFGPEEKPYEDRVRVAQKFLDSGCSALGFSLESGSDEILEAMNKRVKSSFFEEQARLLQEVGLVAYTSIVVGYPQETLETLAETMRMLERVEYYPSVGFLLPLPETGMWAHAVDNGFVTDPDQFLTDITERQDVSLNMTQLPDGVLEEEVKKWLKYLNKMYGNELSDENLIKTGGESKHMKHKYEQRSAHELQRKQNEGNTLSYAGATGGM